MFLRLTLLVAIISAAGCSQMDLNQFAGLGKAGAMPTIKKPSLGNMDITSAVSAGADLAKAATLDDKQVQGMALQFAGQMDKSSKPAPAGSKVAQRLLALTKGLEREDGLKLNFKAYLNPEVNAFALADGSIRIYSGLMDRFSDDEVLGVIGHEIGHVKQGHTKDKMRLAYAASGVLKGVGSMNNTAGALANSDLVGGMLEKFLNSQFSQSNEDEADDYSVVFLQKHQRNPQGMVNALKKLAKMEEEAGEDSTEFRFLSTHPAPGRRAARLMQAISQGTLPTPATVQQSAPADGNQNLAKEAASEPVEISTGVRALHMVTPGFYVQLAALGNPADAQSKVDQLNRASYKSTTQSISIDGTPYTRVLVGPFATRAQAKAEMQILKGEGWTDADPFIQKMR